MINNNVGKPFVGYVSLTNAAPGPVAFTLNTVRGGGVYALKATEFVIITNITLSSNDTANPLVTVDDGSPTFQPLQKGYVGSALPPVLLTYPPGMLPGYRGVNPRASAPAITAAKTIECTIVGFIATTG